MRSQVNMARTKMTHHHITFSGHQVKDCTFVTTYHDKVYGMKYKTCKINLIKKFMSIVFQFLSTNFFGTIHHHDMYMFVYSFVMMHHVCTHYIH